MIRKLKESVHWSSMIGLFTFCLALVFSTLSTVFREGSSLLLSLAIVAAFIIIGIIADTIGLAAATAKEPHFHALAAKKISGAKEAAYIAKNAPLFSSFFNDVMGDIAGIVSGAASTAVVLQMAKILQTSDGSIVFIIISVLLTSIIAALTVGGKALCKTIAIYQSTNIVLYTGKVLYLLKKMQKAVILASLFTPNTQQSFLRRKQNYRK
ncbi:hypothetical protein G4V62_09325 [Bacillaceae bacterium SIJ1]|uniref:hypothetical protein n=1 Tax=Litoribacterium kuwaitense TaxID=1398745 RepID=UPI0013ED0870|nr:hypothetical protein [Litoribacterium kuwaitense]NGP45146.1 hypothetical protein [Litoribacterium kuwaitense]